MKAPSIFCVLVVVTSSLPLFSSLSLLRGTSVEVTSSTNEASEQQQAVNIDEGSKDVVPPVVDGGGMRVVGNKHTGDDGTVEVSQEEGSLFSSLQNETPKKEKLSPVVPLYDICPGSNNSSSPNPWW